MAIILKCEHDKTKLKATKTIAGTIYLCPHCKCRYRLIIAVNDKDCFNKRFPYPTKPTEKIKKEKKE